MDNLDNKEVVNKDINSIKKKKYFTRKKVLQLAYVFGITVLGSFIGAVAFNVFIVPNQFLSGGAMGIALVIEYLTGINTGIMLLILNIPIFIYGFKKLDLEFMLLSTAGMFTFSFVLSEMGFLRNVLQLNDKLLSSIFGGVLLGIGMGIVFRVGSSAGGLDIISVIVKKYYAFNIGATSTLINLFIIMASSLLFGLKPALYTLITMYISNVVLDKIQDGFNTGKAIFVISDQWEEVGASIMSEVGRGVTYLCAEGAYSGVDKKVVYCVLTISQLAKVKKIIKEVDPEAFITINDTNEVVGRGFRTKAI